MNTPDKWVVLKFKTPTETHRRLLMGWYGGYLGGDSWQLNSGIKKEVVQDKTITVYGYSGSIYTVHKDHWGMSSLMNNVLNKLQQHGKKHNIKITVEGDTHD